jgi:hypothetical protein
LPKRVREISGNKKMKINKKLLQKFIKEEVGVFMAEGYGEKPHRATTMQQIARAGHRVAGPPDPPIPVKDTIGQTIQDTERDFRNAQLKAIEKRKPKTPKEEKWADEDERQAIADEFGVDLELEEERSLKEGPYGGAIPDPRPAATPGYGATKVYLMNPESLEITKKEIEPKIIEIFKTAGIDKSNAYELLGLVQKDLENQLGDFDYEYGETPPDNPSLAEGKKHPVRIRVRASKRQSVAK